jgi:hypothetical protein
MELIWAVLLVVVPALVLLRIYSLTRGLLWLWWHGQEFRDLLHQYQPRTAPAREEIIRQAGGDFFPFGSKAFRLARVARGGDARWSRWLALPLRLVLLAWRYPVFVLLATAYLTAVVQLPLARPGSLHTAIEASSVLVGLALMIGSILLAAESYLSMVILGSYGGSIHVDTLRPRDGRHRILVDMQAFVGAVFTAHVSAVATMYLVSTRIEQYGKLPGAPTSFAAAANHVLDCSYYSLFTLLGANDPEPRGPVGKVATGLIGLQSFALLFVALGAIFSLSPTAHPGPTPNPVQPLTQAESVGSGRYGASTSPISMSKKHLLSAMAGAVMIGAVLAIVLRRRFTRTRGVAAESRRFRKPC